VKQGKSRRGAQVLAGLTLMALLSAMAGCTTSRAKPLADEKQLPVSQATTEIRTTQPYILDVGDEVVIAVWGFDEFKKTAVISANGDIYLPLVGRVQLAGKTVPQTQEMLTAKLKKYIVDPQVDVTSSVGRQQIYVVGEVTTPGTQSYVRPLMVMEAIAKAGWFSVTANKSKVLLVRRANDRFHVYQINPQKVFTDGSMAPQTYLQAGDLIYVPPSVITNMVRFMNNVQSILQPFMTAEQMVLLWPAFKTALQGGGPGLSISTPSGAPSQ
jgi:protein involved in polysaccharide export with SLBB domain